MEVIEGEELPRTLRDAEGQVLQQSDGRGGVWSAARGFVLMIAGAAEAPLLGWRLVVVLGGGDARCWGFGAKASGGGVGCRRFFQFAARPLIVILGSFFRAGAQAAARAGRERVNGRGCVAMSEESPGVGPVAQSSKARPPSSK